MFVYTNMAATALTRLTLESTTGSGVVVGVA